MGLNVSSEDLIRAIVESSQDAIIGKSLDGTILAWNGGAEKLYGYSAAQAIGQSMKHLLPDDRLDDEMEALKRIQRGDNPGHFETVRLQRDGTLIDISLTISPICEPSGRIIGTSHIARDITERKRLEEQLRQLALIVEWTEDAIISKDLSGTILTWNRAAERIYGYTRAEAVGMKMEMLSPEDRPNEERDILDRISRGEHANHFETIRRTKTGTLIDVSLAISPVRDQHGAIIGASHVTRDVTDRKRADKKLFHTQKLESLGTLAGGIAHDFNNILTGILGNVSFVLDILPLDHPMRSTLDDVMHASERAAQLTMQLLAYAGRASFVIQPANLSRVVRNVLSLIRTSIPAHVHIQLALSDHLAMINGDSSQLQQLVMNLIINAAESVAPETTGTVTVRTCMRTLDNTLTLMPPRSMELTAGRYVCLEVQDTGSGMDKETLAHIFDPFFTTKFTGRGLGLAAIQGIVRGHNGAIEVQSNIGEGSVFRVMLPTTLEVEVSEPIIPRETTRANGELILVVDDEASILRTAELVLRHHNYAVVCAGSGIEGITLYKQQASKVAAVVLDMTMPNMNGEETFARLRAINPAVRIIVCSGFAESNVTSRFTGMKPNAFVQKPFSAKQLVAAVDLVIKGPEPEDRALATDIVIAQEEDSSVHLYF